jgi:transposase
MQLVYERCAGLDLHKKSVVACAITPDERGQRQKVLQTFSTMTPDLLRLRDWLQSLGVTQVAMESTGVFWKPVFNLLEGFFDLLVVNAQHIKAVPGRKTDVRDAEWIADLRHAWIAASQLHPARVAASSTRSDALPHQCDRRTHLGHQPRAEAARRREHQTGLGGL